MRNSKRNKFSAKRKVQKQIEKQLEYFALNLLGNDDFIPDYTNQLANPGAYVPGNNFSVRLSKQ